MIFHVIFVCSIGLLTFCHGVTKMCNSGDLISCCSGYRWDNVQRNCILCERGFFGKNCADPCPPNFYGQDCQDVCDCNEEDFCDNVEGCVSMDGEVGKAGNTASTNQWGNENEIAYDNNGSHPKPNRTCDKSSPKTKPKMTLVMTGVIVLAVVAFIMSLCLLFIERMAEHFKLTNF